MTAPVEIYVKGDHPGISAAARRAVQVWNDSVRGTIVKLVEPGTPGAIPIVLHHYPRSFAFDEEAEFTGMTGEGGKIVGSKAALLNEDDLTLAHEIGHALGLYHPFPTSTSYRYIPATEQRAIKALEGPRPARAWHVAPVGVMGNEMSPKSPNYRGYGPSYGEIEYLRKRFEITPEAQSTYIFNRAPQRVTGARRGSAPAPTPVRGAPPPPRKRKPEPLGVTTPSEVRPL